MQVYKNMKLNIAASLVRTACGFVLYKNNYFNPEAQTNMYWHRLIVDKARPTEPRQPKCYKMRGQFGAPIGIVNL